MSTESREQISVKEVASMVSMMGRATSTPIAWKDRDESVHSGICRLDRERPRFALIRYRDTSQSVAYAGVEHCQLPRRRCTRVYQVWRKSSQTVAFHRFLGCFVMSCSCGCFLVCLVRLPLFAATRSSVNAAVPAAAHTEHSSSSSQPLPPQHARWKMHCRPPGQL